MGGPIDRRQFLFAAGGFVGLAGCSSSSDKREQVEVQDVPKASFEFQYDEGTTLDDSGTPWADSEADGVLIVTHRVGDPIPADELTIRGTGLTTADDGQWYAQANASPSGPDGDVTTGDETAIEADSDFEVEVVWDPPGENNGAVFASFEGPDA